MQEGMDGTILRSVFKVQAVVHLVSLAHSSLSVQAVSTAKGQALADEYGIQFFETSAKTNLNVEQVFFSIARDIKQRLAETDSKPEDRTIKINKTEGSENPESQKSACCGS